MNTSAIVCSILAGTLGFGSLAAAQDRGDRRDRQDRLEQRQERREARQEMRAERRWDRRELRQERQATRQDYAYRQGYRAGVSSQPSYVYSQPRYVQSQPAYIYRYSQPSSTYSTARYYRGGYLPYEYRQQGYYLSDWNAYPGLYAPPHGHQWMQVGNDFLLVALATGLIANLLTH
jgi:Ni/Co efflux regulator RcnB